MPKIWIDRSRRLVLPQNIAEMAGMKPQTYIEYHMVGSSIVLKARGGDKKR